MHTIRTFLITAAIAVGLAGLATLDTRVAAQGPIRGCVQKASGQIRIIGPTDDCRRDESLLTWNGPPTGSITGQVVNSCDPNADMTGIVVHVPGRGLTAILGISGAFRFDLVPPDTYTLSVEKNGSSVGSALATVSTGTVNVGSIDLSTGSCGGGTTCQGGQTLCGGSTCVNLLTDPSNCGKCGTACTSGQTCSNGACTGGTTLQANGTACTTGSQCQSGNCAQSQGGGLVCTDTACTGACQISVNGTCTIAAAGTNPKGLCAGFGTICGGSCNGTSTQCVFPASSTVCQASSCSGSTFTGASTCNGSGTCVTSPATQCSPFACNLSGCLTSCSSDLQCASTAFCNSLSVCQTKFAHGLSCTGNNQCQSGVCTLGVCQ